METQDGRRLSAASRAKIEEAIQNSETCTATLKSILAGETAHAVAIAALPVLTADLTVSEAGDRVQ